MVDGNSFQQLYFDRPMNSLSIDTFIILVSDKFPIISEQVVVNFMA